MRGHCRLFLISLMTLAVQHFQIVVQTVLSLDPPALLSSQEKISLAWQISNLVLESGKMFLPSPLKVVTLDASLKEWGTGSPTSQCFPSTFWNCHKTLQHWIPLLNGHSSRVKSQTRHDCGLHKPPRRYQQLGSLIVQNVLGSYSYSLYYLHTRSGKLSSNLLNLQCLDGEWVLH